MIGTKIRALADCGVPRDLIDVFAACRLLTTAELEEFGRRRARGRFAPSQTKVDHSAGPAAVWTPKLSGTQPPGSLFPKDVHRSLSVVPLILS